MIIYDKEDNFGGKIKGMLHMNLIDADYLLKKYGEEELKKMMPEDYVDYMAEEVSKRGKEERYSRQYYSSLTMGIENESDERLLTLLSQEVEMGNLFTRSQLSSIDKETLKHNIDELTDKASEDLDDIYKKRSFMMAEFVISSIESFNAGVDKAYAGMKVAGERDILAASHNFEAMGVTSDIKESNYFSRAVELAKKLGSPKK